MSRGAAGLQTAVLETTWGEIAIEAGSRGVVACRLPHASAQTVAFRVLRVRFSRGAGPVLRQAVAYARRLLAGLALDGLGGTPASFADRMARESRIWAEEGRRLGLGG